MFIVPHVDESGKRTRQLIEIVAMSSTGNWPIGSTLTHQQEIKIQSRPAWTIETARLHWHCRLWGCEVTGNFFWHRKSFEKIIFVSSQQMFHHHFKWHNLIYVHHLQRVRLEFVRSFQEHPQPEGLKENSGIFSFDLHQIFSVFQLEIIKIVGNSTDSWWRSPCRRSSDPLVVVVIKRPQVLADGMTVR